MSYRYRIVNIVLPAVILENVKSKERFTTDIYALDQHFRYEYCTTCYSAQGASIDGKRIVRKHGLQ